MITLNLLHPIESIPIQTWQFESEPVIRIGRSGDNHVILYSSVVSRYHVELHRHSSHWEIVNIGANGTYINDQQVVKERVEDGIIFRLAATGPKLQVLLNGAASPLTPQQTATTKSSIPVKPSDSRPNFR